MNCVALASLASLAIGLIAAAQPLAAAQDTPVAPAAQYQTLMNEWNAASRGLWVATTDEERDAVVERVVELTPRLVELAEHNAGDPIAFDCLLQAVVQEIWLANNTKFPGREGESVEAKAIALLLKDHAGSEKLTDACTRMSYGFSKDCETFLRTTGEKSPHKEVKGLACFRLAQFLNSRLRRLDVIEGQPEMAKRYEKLFGKGYLEDIQRRDRAAAIKEVESLFVRAAAEFGDLPLPYGGTVAASANSELNEIRHLSIGMQAPEMESEDQDGKHFKLSDYRGKVVMLYFWSQY